MAADVAKDIRHAIMELLRSEGMGIGSGNFQVMDNIVEGVLDDSLPGGAVEQVVEADTA